MRDGAIPKITDYGLAKLLDSVPCSTSGEGTMNYRAPELLKPTPDGQPGRRSKASDIYALAGICYAMHECKDPYALQNKQTVWTSILKGPPARPRIPPPNPKDPKRPIPDPIWKLLLTCWNEVVDERPTINSIVRRLESGELSK